MKFYVGQVNSDCTVSVSSGYFFFFFDIFSECLFLPLFHLGAFILMPRDFWLLIHIKDKDLKS